MHLNGKGTLLSDNEMGPMRTTLLAVMLCAAYWTGGARAEETERPNLLENPGFEDMPEDLIQGGVVLAPGDGRSIPGWRVRCSGGKIGIRGDTRDAPGGETSLRVQFLSAETDENICTVRTRIMKIKPNTIYELGGMIKAYNVNWVMSNSPIREYGKDGDRVGGGALRLVTYPKSSGFHRRRLWYATGPRARSVELEITWRGRPQAVGIIPEPAMVWMDDMFFAEVGPVYPASGEYLRDDFEGERLDNWILTQSGAHWRPTGPDYGDKRSPHVSDEQAHGGKRSLKLLPTWGRVERPFAENITDCVVTAWFYEEPGDRCRMVSLIDDQGAQVGLGTHRESVTNYSCLLGGKPQVTEIKKSAEWHEFKWDVTQGRGVTCYIDGIRVGETDRMDSFRVLEVGENFWRGSTCYVDDISIQRKGPEGGSGAAVPPGWTAETVRMEVGTPDGAQWKDITRYKNTVGMAFVLIPAGEFMMGSVTGEKYARDDEWPQHRVRITRPFYLGVCEVTNEQYNRFVSETGYDGHADAAGGSEAYEAYLGHQSLPKYSRYASPAPEYPVVLVSWTNAQKFCEWLSRKEGVVYRLPTEAEWEYACRAGTKTRWYFGDDRWGLAQHAWCGFTAGMKSHPVAQKRANPWGLYDMGGNVWEWCQDWYNWDYYKQSPVDDPPGPPSSTPRVPEMGERRVLRGGSFVDVPQFCRSANRDSEEPSVTHRVVGFRVLVAPQ